MRLVRAGGYWTAASSKQKAEDQSDECFYLLRKARKSGNGLAWRVKRGAGSHVQRQRTTTQFPAGHSDRIFQLKEGTISPGVSLARVHALQDLQEKKHSHCFWRPRGAFPFPGRGRLEM